MKRNEPSSSLGGQSIRPDADASKICPNCRSGTPEVFYSVKQVPVHCLQLIADRQTAINYPRHDIKLGMCDGCGFITNLKFDPAALDYAEFSDSYEESQGSSATFRRFSQNLAKRIVENYGLQHKKVLEIGCGKGGFLVDLIEAGMGHGIGYDPAYAPGRIESSALDRLEFRRELFTKDTPPQDVDLFCCRHTLEHIPDTYTFLRNVRKNIGNREEALLFIEVPDATRILAEGAFWDIFYEHCSYFSSASLEAVFRAAGFEMIESWLEYNDQYLMGVGRPVARQEMPPQVDVEEIVSLRASFQKTATECIANNRRRIAEYATQGRKVIVWGSGSKCVGYLSTLGAETANQIDSVVDISPYRQGYYMPGLPQLIVPPKDLIQRKPDVVIVMNPIYQEEIGDELQSMGLSPELVTI